MNQEFSPTNHSLKLIAANKGLSKVDDFWKKHLTPKLSAMFVGFFLDRFLFFSALKH